MARASQTKTVRVHVNNDVFQTLVTLRDNRSKRHRRGLFVVEGVRAINAARTAQGYRVAAFVYSATRALSDWARSVLDTVPVETHYVLADPLMRAFSQREETSELVALVAIPEDRLERIDTRMATHAAQQSHYAPLVVLLDRPASPGNLGTLIRSCDALGADGVVVTGHAADPYDPECVRASTGSLFALPVVRLQRADALDRWLATVRDRWPELRRVGTDEGGDIAIDAQDFRLPTLLLLGNETWGLSAAYRASCDALVSIPMVGSASSLNLACAGSIVLYEIARQRRMGGVRAER